MLKINPLEKTQYFTHLSSLKNSQNTDIKQQRNEYYKQHPKTEIEKLLDKIDLYRRGRFKSLYDIIYKHCIKLLNEQQALLPRQQNEVSRQVQPLIIKPYKIPRQQNRPLRRRNELSKLSTLQAQPANTNNQLRQVLPPLRNQNNLQEQQNNQQRRRSNELARVVDAGDEISKTLNRGLRNCLVINGF